MAKATMVAIFFIFVLCFSLSMTIAISAVSPSETSAAAAASFIKAQCSITEYPILCEQSLSAYANTIGKSPKEVARAALSVSIARAKDAKDSVGKLRGLGGLRKREAGAVQDCLEEIGDSVDRLRRSAEEMKKVGAGGKGEEEFVWHVSNVETWVSAALTDEDTCMDGLKGLEGAKLKASIRSMIVNVAQVTSNALAIVTRFASTYV